MNVYIVIMEYTLFSCVVLGLLCEFAVAKDILSDGGNPCPVPMKYWAEENVCIWEERVRTSWNSARANCQHYEGGDLVVILNIAKNNFVANMYTSSTAWIGLRKAPSKTFKWVNGVVIDPSKSDFMSWGLNKPTDNVNSSCIATQGRLGWVDVACQIDVHSFCEVQNASKCLYQNGGCQHYCRSKNLERICYCRQGFKILEETECMEAPDTTTDDQFKPIMGVILCIILVLLLGAFVRAIVKRISLVRRISSGSSSLNEFREKVYEYQTVQSKSYNLRHSMQTVQSKDDVNKADEDHVLRRVSSKTTETTATNLSLAGEGNSGKTRSFTSSIDPKTKLPSSKKNNNKQPVSILKVSVSPSVSV